MTYGWTQSLCDDCWRATNPDRDPVRLTERREEVCVDCGESTNSGIYIRIDPSVTKFPSLEK
jgi:hypothetical protein